MDLPNIVLPDSWGELLLMAWWQWAPAQASIGDWCYHVFNLAEACVWFACAIHVARRWYQRGRWHLDWLYVLAWLAFGASDLVESQLLTLWLIAWKAANLGLLVSCVLMARKRYYIGEKF